MVPRFELESQEKEKEKDKETERGRPDLRHNGKRLAFENEVDKRLESPEKRVKASYARAD